ncbi:endonuclease/exonuclease/phosphatase family protein [Novosphingobium sp. PASSN1]|uniref:endonuclease/exonuclease/phosphatase family protein n=1 Tax=Novosphingobium sp. PASSN1 TaxID=2015561 RepID=UPI0025FD5499|nr:endonuclease/exonuclease/phosphatase family protein [Novosphingobium sp. PASSN1]
MKILTYNLGLLNLTMAGRHVFRMAPAFEARLAAAPALLAATGADVLMLQEVFGRRCQQRLIHALRGVYPHAVGAPQNGTFGGSGLLILSRHPLHDPGFSPYRDRDLLHAFWQQGFLHAALDAPGFGLLRLVNVHLSISAGLRHPLSAGSMACREREIAALMAACSGRAAPGQKAAGIGGPDLLVGDFNCGPNYAVPNYAALLASGYKDGFVLANGSDHEHAGYSWNAANPIVAAGRYRGLPNQRVDHLFVPQSGLERLRVKRARLVLEDAAVKAGRRMVPLSDHYGMLFELDPAAAAKRGG